jgi:hypothetical protein
MTQPRLKALEAERAAQFHKMADVVAGELGLGEYSTLTPEQKERVDDRVEELIEQWNQTETLSGPHSVVRTALQTLLRQHHQTGESILEIRDARLSSKDDDPFTHGESDD